MPVGPARIMPLLILLLATGAKPRAEDSPEIAATPPQQRQADLLDKSRNYLGDFYLNLAHKLDIFVSRRQYERETNKSQLSLTLDHTWYESGERNFDLNARTRVDLPGAEERLRLFFETDPEEGQTLAERNRTAASDQQPERGRSVAGVEFSKPTEATRWKHSISLGARYKDGIDPLVRYRLRRYWQLPDKWVSLYRQDFWHQGSIGWGSTSHLEFTRPLTENDWFNVLAQYEIRDHDEPVEYANVWRVVQQLDPSWKLTWKLGLLGSSDENKIYDDRFVNVSLGYRLNRNWVYLYLTPEVFYSEELNYQPERSLTLSFELFFTDQ